MKNTDHNIVIKNAQVHNLKGVSLELQPNQLVCFTGISGSGKSSLAFDTIYIEGQRRYVESLSPHARRFLGDLPRPKIESANGISPTISIEQKTIGKNPRSTVGTITEIYDYLRVLFARSAIPHCPISKEAVRSRSLTNILQDIISAYPQQQIIILAPYIKGKKGTLADDLEAIGKRGFSRVRVDGSIYHLADDLRLEKSTQHNLDIIVDRLDVNNENQDRLRESITVALECGNNTCIILNPLSSEEQLFSTMAYSPKSGLSYSPLEPHDFSFNSPQGMCPDCQGMGEKQEFKLDLIIDPSKSISEDVCLVASSYTTVRYRNIYDNLSRMYDFNVKTPWKKLSDEAKKVFLYGTEKKWTRMHFVHPITKAVWVDNIQWRGVLHEAYDRYKQAKSDSYKRKLEKLMHLDVCPTCNGSRIKAYPTAATLLGKSLPDIVKMTIGDAYSFFKGSNFDGDEALIANPLIKEINERLLFLINVGLDYLQLERKAPTLSGGEAQRVRLASQIGSGLVGVTYVLDEPSIGLHPRDNKKLITSLKQLRDKGNTVIIVEHDEETIHAADHIVDFGPKAGVQGGEILFSGPLNKLLKQKGSLTADYLSKRKKIHVPDKRRKPTKKTLTIKGAYHHNVKNVHVSVPLGCFVAVTGVSGSGKSSLFLETLYPAVHNILMKGELPSGRYSTIEGLNEIDKIIEIDQSPIGRTPRSNPATYIGLFDDIRELFSELPDSKAQGFKSGRFSFNVKEGSCNECHGMGMVKIEMDFLEDSFVLCPTCEGKRFDEETLKVRYKEKNIQDVLEMDVAEALAFFSPLTHVRKKLEMLVRVGLDYIKLGQSSTTLSGGEAQRIKLAKELVRPSTGKTLYILDEPTTGLHFHDISHLLEVLHALVDAGNTVVVIEHNMDLIKTADWIIDMGPESGDGGGNIVAEGIPETIAKIKSPTGIYLHDTLHEKPYPSTENRKIQKQKSAQIVVRGACQNNLKSVDCEITKNAITAIIGPSGSGKSSLAFETIYAEGQRRYVESLSAYVRQFVKQLPKPNIEQIEGLCPSIAIEQRVHASNPRSTVGTMTEIYDYLRILYARLGVAHCPKTGFEIKAIGKESVVERILTWEVDSSICIMAPITLKKSQPVVHELERLLKLGYLRVYLNGSFIDLTENLSEVVIDPKKKNELYLVIDRIKLKSSLRSRIYEAIRLASSHSKGKISVLNDKKLVHFNLAFSVEETGESYPEITPHTFAFNTPEGMCPECQGLGSIEGFLLETLPLFSLSTPLEILSLLIPKKHLTPTLKKHFEAVLKALRLHPNITLHQQDKDKITQLFHGIKDPIIVQMDEGEAAINWTGINRAFTETIKLSHEDTDDLLSTIKEKRSCPLCQGERLNPLARRVTLKGVSLPTLAAMTLTQALSFIQQIPTIHQEDASLKEVFDEIIARLTFLIEIGLTYISLSREASSLSGGEEQRVRLARQIGSGLTAVLYVLDEPTTGLHPKDIEKLLLTLKKLQSLGNTLIVVEHDPQLILAADEVLELGPASGKEGGHITFKGSVDKFLSSKTSFTRKEMLTRHYNPTKKQKRKTGSIQIRNAHVHNLKNISLDIPLGQFTCMTGVSGSGKSTLLFDVILKDLQKTPHEALDKIIVVDQKPIGHTIRSDVATYLDILTDFRDFFSLLPDARSRGLLPKNFSYYHRSGMCPSCQGLGYKRIHLHFLPDIQVICPECRGLRLKHESLQIRYHEKNLGEILSLTCREVAHLFSAQPKITRKLKALADVGLDYLPLCQEMHTLSSGEAGRMKLAFALSKRAYGKVLYLLDEPTTGLHLSEVTKIYEAIQSLVDSGHTVIAIEHNLDLISRSDTVIDLGPGPADEGGTIVAKGSPEEVANVKESYTGQFLARYLAPTTTL